MPARKSKTVTTAKELKKALKAAKVVDYSIPKIRQVLGCTSKQAVELRRTALRRTALRQTALKASKRRYQPLVLSHS
jgi:hypothetical protein